MLDKPIRQHGENLLIMKRCDTLSSYMQEDSRSANGLSGAVRRNCRNRFFPTVRFYWPTAMWSQSIARSASSALLSSIMSMWPLPRMPASDSQSTLTFRFLAAISLASSRSARVSTTPSSGKLSPHMVQTGMFGKPDLSRRSLVMPGSTATIAATAPGRVRAACYPKSGPCECVTNMAGPIRSSRAINGGSNMTGEPGLICRILKWDD